MAVNINKVYQRVLFLANKEQRGYITPDEFNSFADQAQLEIFEDYLSKKLGVQASGSMSTDEYGDAMSIIDERLTYFDNSVEVTTKTALTTGATSENGFAYPSDLFRLGVVRIGIRVADEVGNRDLAYLLSSPLTYPTANQPVYTRYEGGVLVFPETITAVEFDYLRRPSVPFWAHMAAPTGEPIYNAAGSTDFELHPGEEDDLVYRILALSGVAIKAPDVTGFGKQNEQ